MRSFVSAAVIALEVLAGERAGVGVHAAIARRTTTRLNAAAALPLDDLVVMTGRGMAGGRRGNMISDKAKPKISELSNRDS